MYILYNVRGTRSVLITNCTCYATEDAVRIVTSFISIPITRNYNHSQLFLTLLRVYTLVILARSELQSLIPLLHVYTIYKQYTLIFTALLHIKSPNLLNTSSLADFSAIGHFHRLSHTFANAKSSIHTASRLRYLLRKTLAEISLREFPS
jgi:hypothetical protein